MRKNLQRRVYTEQEFKKADRITRLKIHLCHPHIFVLNARDEEYLHRIRRCYVIMSERYTEASQMKMLTEEFSTIARPALYKLIQDTKQFYGDFTTETKKFNWKQQGERLYKHLERAEEEEDYKTIVELEKLIIKHRSEMPDVDDQVRELPPAQITFSNDPQLLAKGGYHDVEDAEIVDEEE